MDKNVYETYLESQRLSDELVKKYSNILEGLEFDGQNLLLITDVDELERIYKKIKDPNSRNTLYFYIKALNEGVSSYVQKNIRTIKPEKNNEMNDYEAQISENKNFGIQSSFETNSQAKSQINPISSSSVSASKQIQNNRKAIIIFACILGVALVFGIGTIFARTNITLEDGKYTCNRDINKVIDVTIKIEDNQLVTGYGSYSDKIVKRLSRSNFILSKYYSDGPIELKCSKY